MVKRTQAEWDIYISKYRTSNQSQQEWCNTQGINLYTFRNRLSKMNKVANSNGIKNICKARESKKTNDKQQEVVKWLTIGTNGNKAEIAGYEAAAQQRFNKEIQVKVGNFTIMVEASFEEAAFCKVCKALNSLC